MKKRSLDVRDTAYVTIKLITVDGNVFTDLIPNDGTLVDLTHNGDTSISYVACKGELTTRCNMKI